MHPAVRNCRPGRNRTRQISFPFYERTMPAPPAGAKAMHDYHVRNTLPDPLGVRYERKWVNPGTNPAPPKYCRHYAHGYVFNTCEREKFFLKPEYRRLQCFYFPKLPKEEKKMLYQTRQPRVHKRAASFFARPEMWGAWDIDSHLPDDRQRAETAARYVRGDMRHTRWYYRQHKGDIERLRELHRLGLSNYRSWRPPVAPPKPVKQLATRQEWDVDHIRGLKYWKPNVDGLVERGYIVL